LDNTAPESAFSPAAKAVGRADTSKETASDSARGFGTNRAALAIMDITAAISSRRRALLAGFIASLLAIEPAFSAVPRGVFCLLPSGQGAGRDAVIYSDPNVDGVSVRHRWSELERSDGVFDFTFLDAVVTMARVSGKKVLLRIGTSGGSAAKGGNTPNWVLDAIKAEPLPDSQKFFTWNDNGVRRTIPVFWDAVYLAKKKAMIRALGAHFANNPAVKIVSASFANAQSEDWAVPHTSTDVANWLAAGYTTNKMLNAGKQIIDTTMAAFPSQYVTMAVGGNGHTGRVNLDPSENYLARNAVLAARASWPGRLIVQKNNLATFTPPAPGSNTLYGLLWDSAPDVGAQMLWRCYHDPSYRVNGGVPIDPTKALIKSVNIGIGYETKYIEIYRKDILNLPTAAKYAHDALMAAP
jgi:Beta-galactosidase